MFSKCIQGWFTPPKEDGWIHSSDVISFLQHVQVRFINFTSTFPQLYPTKTLKHILSKHQKKEPACNPQSKLYHSGKKHNNNKRFIDIESEQLKPTHLSNRAYIIDLMNIKSYIQIQPPPTSKYKITDRRNYYSNNIGKIHSLNAKRNCKESVNKDDVNVNNYKMKLDVF